MRRLLPQCSSRHLYLSPLSQQAGQFVCNEEIPCLCSSDVGKTIDCSEQGIFLSPLEEQSSLLFNFVFKMFSIGSASLPEGGMGEVPKQIAADLPEGTGCRVPPQATAVMHQRAGGFLIGRLHGVKYRPRRSLKPSSLTTAVLPHNCHTVV